MFTISDVYGILRMMYHEEGSRMAKTKKKIVLSSEQRDRLRAYLSSGSKSVRLTKRVYIMFALDASNDWLPPHDGQLANIYHVSR
jgi:hypothetical protein